MTVTRSATDPEFLVDYSTLVVRDSGPGTGEDDERLAEDAATLSVTGRLAVAGQGWLCAQTRADYLHVVLELHDAPPSPEPAAQGVELMETPYLSSSGAVALDSLVSMAGSTVLQLDEPGLYRVRVRKEPDPELERWRLSFWRETGESQPPRWYALAPVRDDGATATRSWRSVLPYEAVELLEPLQSEPGASLTVEEYAEFWRRHGRRRDYLDDVLLPDRAPRTTGFPDLDVSLSQSRDQYDDERRATWTNLAHQLGIRLPRTRGDLLELLLAAGLLTRTDRGAYALVPDPPHPRDVLHLPEQHVGREERQQRQRLHGDLAADVERVVLWSPGRTHRTTLPELAERLLTTPARVRAALEYAQQTQHVVVEGDPAAPGAPLVLTLPDTVPRDGDGGYADVGSGDDDVTVRYVEDDVTVRYVGDARPRQEALRDGPPPEWGVVVDGDLWRWTGGRASRARLDDPWCDQALRTAAGTLLLHAGAARLVDDEGSVHDLGQLGPVALDRRGRLLAGVEARYGRRRSTFRLHAVDLTTRERVTMPWPADRLIREVAFDEADGSITFRAEPDADDPASDDVLHRWRSGQDPVAEPGRDGTPGRHRLRTRGDETGLHLTWPSGTRQHYRVDGQVRASPLAPLLYSLRADPPAVAVWHLQETALVEPRVLPLPEGAQAHSSGPGQPVWESGSSLLLTVSPYSRNDGTRALRLDVRTGEVERVPLPEGDGMGMGDVAFVEGLPDT